MATGASAALYMLNPSAFLGPIQPTTTGFAWNLLCVFREPQTNRKEVTANVIVETLDGDSLVNIRDKLAAGVKAEGLARDFNVASVAFFQLATVAV